MNEDIEFSPETAREIIDGYSIRNRLSKGELDLLNRARVSLRKAREEELNRGEY